MSAQINVEQARRLAGLARARDMKEVADRLKEITQSPEGAPLSQFLVDNLSPPLLQHVLDPLGLLGEVQEILEGQSSLMERQVADLLVARRDEGYVFISAQLFTGHLVILLLDTVVSWLESMPGIAPDTRGAILKQFELVRARLGGNVALLASLPILPACADMLLDRTSSLLNKEAETLLMALAEGAEVESALSKVSYHAITQALWALVVPAAKAAGRVCEKMLAHNIINKPGLLTPGLSEVIVQASTGVGLIYDVVTATRACRLPDGASAALQTATFAHGVALGNTANQSLVKTATVLHSLEIKAIKDAQEAADQKLTSMEHKLANLEQEQLASRQERSELMRLLHCLVDTSGVTLPAGPLTVESLSGALRDASAGRDSTAPKRTASKVPQDSTMPRTRPMAPSNALPAVAAPKHAAPSTPRPKKSAVPSGSEQRHTSTTTTTTTTCQAPMTRTAASAAPGTGRITATPSKASMAHSAAKGTVASTRSTSTAARKPEATRAIFRT